MSTGPSFNSPGCESKTPHPEPDARPEAARPLGPARRWSRRPTSSPTEALLFRASTRPFLPLIRRGSVRRAVAHHIAKCMKTVPQFGSESPLRCKEHENIPEIHARTHVSPCVDPCSSAVKPSRNPIRGVHPTRYPPSFVSHSFAQKKPKHCRKSKSHESDKLHPRRTCK